MKDTTLPGGNQAPVSPSCDESTDKPTQNFLFAMIPDEIMCLKEIDQGEDDPIKISPGAKLVFGVIYSLKQASAGRCYASNERIAEKTGLTVQQVKRLLPVLEAAKLIKRVAKKGAKCTRDSIDILWRPTQQLGEKCTQQLGEKCTQQLGEKCTPENTSQESFQERSVVSGSVGATRDVEREGKARKKPKTIPQDVLDDVTDYLGDDLAARIAKAAGTFHKIVGERWDALVDAAEILRDELAIGDDDDGVRNPMRYFIGTVKNVHSDLLADDRVDAEGFMSVHHFGRVSQETVRGIHDGKSPSEVHAIVMAELNEYGEAGSLLTRMTEATIHNCLVVARHRDVRDLACPYLDPDGKLNRWARWGMEDSVAAGIAYGETAETILTELAEATKDASPHARQALDDLVWNELECRLPAASVPSRRVSPSVPDEIPFDVAAMPAVDVASMPMAGVAG